MPDAAASPPEDGVQVRTSLSAADVEAVSAVCRAAAAADGVEPLSEHVRLHLRHGGEEPDRHLLVRDGGELAGYAHLDPTDAVDGPSAELVVHPDHRGKGLGRALVQALVTAAGDDRLRLWAHGDHPAARALAASGGFEEVRRLLQLRRSLTGLPDLELPASIVIRTFRPGEDEDPWLEVNALAFADHPEQGRWTRADLDVRMKEAWFDPEGFLLAVTAQDPADIAGFHWTKVHGDPGTGPGSSHAHPPIGEVYVVGVHPRHRSEGLGSALTLAGLHRLREQGLDEAMLYVEADNRPALAIYEGLGFTLQDRDVMFRRRTAPNA